MAHAAVKDFLYHFCTTAPNYRADSGLRPLPLPHLRLTTFINRLTAAFTSGQMFTLVSHFGAVLPLLAIFEPHFLPLNKPARSRVNGVINVLAISDICEHAQARQSVSEGLHRL
jgi:hypothetical protein